MRRILIWVVIALPILLIVGIAGAYAYDEVVNADKVGRNVSAAGVDLSGLSAEDASAAIADYEQRLVATPALFVVDGQDVMLSPSDAGLAVDEESVAADALAQRREGGFYSDVSGWLESFWTPVEIEVPTAIDDNMLEGVFHDWDRSVVDHPAYEGAVVVNGTIASPEYPRPGSLIDRSQANGLVASSLDTLDRLPIALPLTDLDPVVTNADVDAAVERANDLIGDPVLLSREGIPGRLTVTSTGLAMALRSEIKENSPVTITVELDEDVLRALTERKIERFATPPVDASFEFDKDTQEITVIPSEPGIVVDLDALPGVVIDAALGSGNAEMPTKVGEAAALTTEMAEAMGPFGEVSTFTTYHPCCQNRVINIQKLADEIDGAVVMPGDIFSINDHAGKRTTAEGYVRAGAIIGGRVECCDHPANVGGGTSQFATTFYNAIFFGCYEDIEHKPHSLYFSRYPFVREATLGFPYPDVKFRNDSAAPVFIDTSHTGGSITVTFYGNNGGRLCSAERSGNTVTRLMEHPDGSVTTQSWTWNYAKPKPPTTTTTKPAPTTTTVATTTTAATTTTTA
ncbi:MAG: VanW family protein, partial [Actinomycetota bacterium]